MARRGFFWFEANTVMARTHASRLAVGLALALAVASIERIPTHVGRGPGGLSSARPPDGKFTSGAECDFEQGAGSDSAVHLTFLATNDLHGALEGKVHSWSEGREVGGAAVLAAYIAEERAENPEGTVLLDGGDIMQGTPISNLVQGRSVIEFFNAVGYDAAAIGNHEFDWGIETLEERRHQARFPLLSANIRLKADGTRPGWSPPTEIIQRKGVKIGLIGLTTRSTPTATLPVHVVDLEFTDLALAANEAVHELERQGADLVVVMAHAGGYFSADSGRYRGEIVDAMRRMDPAVDLVISGHSHTLLDGEVNGIPLVQARSSGTALAVVEVWVDGRSGEILCSEAEVKTTYADAVRPDAVVADVVERYRAQIGTAAERVIARAAHRLPRQRRRESVLGDLIADAQLAATGAQIALTNSGGIRADIDPGPITWREAFEVQPFGNVLYRFQMDGRTLRDALENGVRGEHGLVQVSGVRFEVDGSAPPGERVRSLTLEDGTAVEPDSLYVVSANEFMAQGGDGYTMLREAPEITNTGLVDLDVFVEHLERLPQPIHYQVQERIRFVAGPPPEEPRDR
jgi:2',3'-cyclic-nucleotide 2'-phosphodiesterase (5'-nucleotidase family)